MGRAKEFLKKQHEQLPKVYYVLMCGLTYWSYARQEWVDRSEAELKPLNELGILPYPRGVNGIVICKEDGEQVVFGSFVPEFADYWKRRFSAVGARARLKEGEEQLGLPFSAPRKFKPGRVRQMLKKLRSELNTWEAAEDIESGRAFRRLAAYPVEKVEVWKTGNFPTRDAVIVLNLRRGDQKLRVRQSWASFQVLCHALRVWRNLQGAPLYVNGVESGVVSYDNPDLVRLGS